MYLDFIFFRNKNNTYNIKNMPPKNPSTICSQAGRALQACKASKVTMPEKKLIASQAVSKSTTKPIMSKTKPTKEYKPTQADLKLIDQALALGYYGYGLNSNYNDPINSTTGNNRQDWINSFEYHKERKDLPDFREKVKRKLADVKKKKL